jgi:hypothetical protein
VRNNGAKESAQHRCTHVVNCCIGESPVIYQGAFRCRYQYQPDPGASLGHLLPAAYRGPVTYRAGFDRALKHIEEAARHCSHAKTPPGESIGLRRSSTGSERVAGFGYRSPRWRVRGVQRPGVFEESLVPPAPDPRGTYRHLSLGSRRAPAALAHMYRPVRRARRAAKHSTSHTTAGTVIENNPPGEDEA